MSLIVDQEFKKNSHQLFMNEQHENEIYDSPRQTAQYRNDDILEDLETLYPDDNIDLP